MTATVRLFDLATDLECEYVEPELYDGCAVPAFTLEQVQAMVDTIMRDDSAVPTRLDTVVLDQGVHMSIITEFASDDVVIDLLDQGLDGLWRIPGWIFVAPDTHPAHF